MLVGNTFLTMFRQEVLPLMEKMGQQGAIESDQKIVVYIFDDVVEFGGEEVRAFGFLFFRFHLFLSLTLHLSPSLSFPFSPLSLSTTTTTATGSKRTPSIHSSCFHDRFYAGYRSRSPTRCSLRYWCQCISRWCTFCTIH